jgi:hypothetical protein
MAAPVGQLHEIDVREHGVLHGQWLAYCQTCPWKTSHPTTLQLIRWDVRQHGANRTVKVWPRESRRTKGRIHP